MQFVKKILAQTLSLSLLIGLVSPVFAATTLEVNSFTINSSTSPQSVAPGDTLNLLSNVLVDGGNATNIGFHLDLPSVGFNYSGSADTQVWWADEIIDIPLVDFNPPTDKDAPLTNSGNANNGDYIDIINFGFTVDAAISTYANTFSANFFSDETTGTSVTRTVYVDVKPHIVSADFSPTSIPNDGSGSTVLTVNVKDFNGCANVDSATVQADLTALGGIYTNSENLTYVSCDGDTQTAVYQKTDITSTSSIGGKNITFTATDEDGNTNDPDDVYFGSIDLNPASLTLTLNAASAPTVTDLAAVDDHIGGTAQTSTNLSWTGSLDTEEYKVVLGDSSDCSGGTTLHDWASGGAGGVSGVSLNASSLSEGANTIYVCGAKSSRSLVGSASLTVTKDTTAATLTKGTISPSSVTTQNVTFNWTSDEIGTYATVINGGGEVGSEPYSVAHQNEATVFANGSLNAGSNTLSIYFYDEAGNQTILSGQASKTSPPPSMSGLAGTLSDSDSLYDGVDGRDLTVTWTSPGSYTYFESYKIYILPLGTSLDTATHTHSGIVPNINTTTWTGDSLVKKDSAGNDLVGGSYVAYVLVQSTAGQKGTAGSTSSSTITSDVVSHPSLVSAEFIDDTELQLEYDVNLSTTLSDHFATNILSQDFTVTASCNGNTNGVKAVNGKYITVCVDSLATQEGSTSAGLAKTVAVIGQIDSLIPADVEIGDIFQFAATGSLSKATFVATDTTVANVTAGLTAAINTADFSDVVSGGLTAEDMSTYVKVSATNFNTSFISWVNTTDGGGQDTQTLDLRRNLENAVRADASGYNCHVNSTVDPSMSGCTTGDIEHGVADGQKPTPLTLGDLVIAENTYSNDDVSLAFKDNITVNLSVPEQLSTNTKLKIEATGGEADLNAPFSISINAYRTAGSHQFELDVSDLFNDSGSTVTDLLNSGTIYQMYVQGYDNAGNSSQSNFKTNLRFDNSAPSVPLTLHFPNQAGENLQHTNDSTPLLQWFSSTDNLSGSGELVYNLDLSVVGDFNTLTQSHTDLTQTSQELTELDTDSVYYWRVNALDQAGNAGAYQSAVESFVFDSTAPVISLPILTDQNLSSVSYTSNANQVVLTATITDTNQSQIELNQITADLTALGGGTAVNPVTYNTGSGLATWAAVTVTCTDGSLNVPVDVTDLAGNAGIQVNATLICDNQAPVVAAETITSPNGSESWAGGSAQDITWISGNITETNFKDLSLFYSANNGTSWTQIASGETNDGLYTWNPLPNLDSAQMLVRVTAYDQVTQSGSDVSDVTFTLDSTDPALTANTLTAPNGGEIIQGGDSLEITWTQGEITDTNLEENPITLAYYNGTSWVEIASGEANDGTYTWNPVPSLNITNAQVRLTATDKAGRTASDASNSTFTIDSVLPSITSAETQDLNADGQIDAVKFTFTENIPDSSVTAGNFDLAGYTGETFSLTTHGDSADNDFIYITFTPSGSADSGATPNYTYTQGTLADFSGNLLATVGATPTTDTARPIVMSRVTQDTNTDGQQDGVLVTFSENMDAGATTNTDYILQTAASADLTENYADTTDDTTLLLGFTDGAAFNTSDLTQSQLNGTFQDLAGNTLVVEGSLTAATDGVAPVFQAQTWIASVTPAVKVTFSENVDSVSDAFSAWGVDGFGVTAIDSLDGTTNSVLISLDSNITDTSLTPDVTYTAGDIVDTTANALPTSTQAAQDSLVPTVTAIEIHDTDSDGSVETAYLQFSENVDDSTLTVAGFTLGGVNADNFSTNAFGDATADDAKIAISLNTSIQGTLTQDVMYTASIGGLMDLASVPNSLSDLATGDIIEQDKAPPALLAATYNDNGTNADASDDEITLTFSEALDDTTLDTVAGNSDLEFTVSGGGSITNATTVSGSANDEVVTIQLNAGDTVLTAGTSSIALQSGVLEDSSGNANTQTTAITLNGSVILNEIMWMGTSLDAADEFIELRNLSASSVDISGWVIQNAANGGNLTLPGSSSIPGNGYFVIANFAAASSRLNLTPDWVTTDLDLADNSNGHLVLKDGGITLDSVKGDTWPAGDGGSFASMERNIAPGDGLVSSNWHTGDAQTNWDGGSTEKGTPGAQNVADAQAPSFQLSSPDSRLPAANSLYPDRLPRISLEYADNDGGSGIDTSAVQVLLDLNNDNDYDDPGEDITAQTSVTPTSISYTPGTALAAGKHTVKVIVPDVAGNSSEIEWIFWLDDFTLTVENIPSFQIVPGSPGTTANDSEHVKVTLTTYGAGVNLKGYLPLLINGGSDLQNWDGSHGIGWDVKEGAGAFTNTIQAFGNTKGTATTLASKAKQAEGTYTAQTYEFYIKIHGDVDISQQAGVYENDLSFLVDLEY